ncbi:hypothetical protein ABT126_42810 [Streptomyces sp. NPDC002012]
MFRLVRGTQHIDRFDVVGALVCLAGMAVIMYAPRGN